MKPTALSLPPDAKDFDPRLQPFVELFAQLLAADHLRNHTGGPQQPHAERAEPDRES